MSSLVDTSQRITDGELPQNASFETLCSYVPVSIVDYLARCQRESSLPAPPFKHTWETAVIFADVSGFTKLSEQLAAKGPSGAEELATKLNKYFQLLVRTIAKEGGDIFKFAGDAVLIIWPVLGEGPKDEDNEERLTTLTRRAVQCANEVQQVLHGYDLSGDDEVVEKQNSKEKVRSVLKLGVGVGKVSVMHVGGLLARMEYIATGQPLIDAFEAESRASPGDVVVSPKALSLVEKGFGFEFNVENGFGFVRDFDPRKKLKRVSVAAKHQLAPSEPTLFRRIQQYIPGAVLPFLNEQEHWASELRRITVMFVNLGFTPKQMDGATEAIQQVMSAVNEAIYSYEGALNKFLMDDKGSTLIAVFGLRPLAHADDAIRGVLTSLLLCSKLEDLGYHASVGIATGVAFCGIVGRQHLRREYSVLGDIVNLSARLMSFASKNGGGVLCCKQTYIRACDRLSFEGPRKITVKGKANLVKIYAPRCSTGSNPLINEGYARTAFRSGLFASNYELQLQHYASHHHVKLELSRSRGKISRRLLEPRPRSARNLPDIGEPFEAFMLEDTSRVNGVIVTLPSGQRVSFVCTELPTIFRLKERLFEIIRENKGSVDGFVSSPSEYMFTVPREQTVLFDESMSLAKLADQAPIVELDLRRWRNHRDLDGDHLKSHRQTLSNAVTSLFNDNEEQGPTIIIEGDMGLGKTTLLTYVICSARVPVICVAGNPFEMNKQLAVFRMPFLQLIDSICADKFGRDAKPYEAHHREDVVASLLGHHAEMSELLPLLNDFVSLQFDTNERCERMDDEERLANLIKLLTGLMLQFCETGPLVCAVDDLIYLDRSSWNLLLSLHRHGRRLLLLMATEPMKRSYLAALSTAVPEQYRQLCRSERTVKIVLEPFPEETITKILREKDVLDNSVIPKRLQKALVKRSLGNPVICRELVWSIKTARLISMRKQQHAGRRHRKGSSEKHSSRSYVELAPSFSEEALDTVPVSPSMQDILGCRMGRLSNIQQMILKTASIIGNQFDFEILCLAYPIEKHLPKLESEFQRLVSNGVVHPVEEAAPTPTPKKKKNSVSDVEANPQRRLYEFSIGMMQNVARSRLLDKQATDLKESVDKADCLAFGEKHLENYVYFMQPSADDRNKPIDCLKNSKWKMRWAEITDDRLVLYHNKRTRIVDRVIMLDKATVMDRHEEKGRDDAAAAAAAGKKPTSFKKMRHASIFRSSKEISHTGSDDTVRRDFFFRLTCKKAEHHPEPTPSVVNCSPIKKSFPSTLTRLNMRKHGGGSGAAPSPSNSGGSAAGGSGFGFGFGAGSISPRNMSPRNVSPRNSGIGHVETVVPPSPRNRAHASPSNGSATSSSSSSGGTGAAANGGISPAHLRQLEYVASAAPRGAGLRGSSNTAPHTVFQRAMSTPDLEQEQHQNGVTSAPITMARGGEGGVAIGGDEEGSYKSTPISPSAKNHLDKHAHHASSLKNGHDGPSRGRARSRDKPTTAAAASGAEPLSSDCVHPISLRSRKGRHITLPPEGDDDHSSRRSTRSTSPHHARGASAEPKRPRSKSPSFIANSNKSKSKRKVPHLQPAMTLPAPDTHAQQKRSSLTVVESPSTGSSNGSGAGSGGGPRVTVRQGPRSLSRTGLRRAKTTVGMSPPFTEMRVENHPQEFIFSCPTENDRRAWCRSIKRAILELTNAAHEQQKSLKSKMKDDVWMPFDRSTIMPPPMGFDSVEDHKSTDEMETPEDETRFFEDFLASRADHTPAKDSLAAIREALSYTLSEQLGKDDPALYESSGNSDSDLLSPHSHRSASTTPQPHDIGSGSGGSGKSSSLSLHHATSIDISGREFKSSASTSSGDSNFSNSNSYHVVVNNHIKQSPATPQSLGGDRAPRGGSGSGSGVPGSPAHGAQMHQEHSRSNVTQVSLSVGDQSAPSVSFNDHRRRSSISSGGSSAQLSDLEEGSRTPSVHSTRSIHSAASSRPTSPRHQLHKRPAAAGGGSGGAASPGSPTGSLSSRTSQSHVAHLGNRSPSNHAMTSSSSSMAATMPVPRLLPRPLSPQNNHRKTHRSTSPEFGPDSPHDSTTRHTRQLSTGSTASARSTRSMQSSKRGGSGGGSGSRSNHASPRHGPRGAGPSPPASPTPMRVGRQSPANTIESSVSLSAQRSRSPNKRRKTLSRGGMLVRYWNAPAQTSVHLQAEAHPLRVGLLHIKKSNVSGLTKPLTQAWKRRFAVLTDDSLIFFKSNKKGVPTESLCLISAVVRLDRHEVFRRNQTKSRRSWRRTMSPDARRSHRHAASNGTAAARSATPTAASSNLKASTPSSNGHHSVGRSGGGFFSMRGGVGRRTSNSSTASESSVASEKANGSEFSRSRGGILSGGHGGSASGPNTPTAASDGSGAAGSGGSGTAGSGGSNGGGGSLSDSASVFLVQCSLWVKRGELHREKRSVAIAAEPEEVLEWVKALRHVTDKHRQFLHENPMFREDIGVNGLADPDPPESQISARGLKSPSVGASSRKHHGGASSRKHHGGKTHSKSGGSGADSEASTGASPTGTRQSNPSDLIDYALDLLNTNGLSQIEMEEILRHLRRVYLQRQSVLTAPISQEDGESIASLLQRSDLDKDTLNWLRKEYTRPDAAYHEPKKSSLELVGSPVSGIGASVHDFKEFLLSPPPTSSCDIKHLSNVFAMPMSKEAIRSLEQWNFNVFHVGSNGPTSLFPSVVKMFERFDVFDRFHIAPMAFVTFLNDVKDAYYDNPYHNFYHGVDVCQTIFSTLTSLGVGEHFSTLEKFALLLAALLHDLRHPGLSNTYQVNAMTQLAVFYNDQSVLENHHCASAFGIFRNHELLQGLSKEEYRTLRKIIISAILATDMTCHFELLRKFNSRIEADWKSPDGPPPSPSHARSATFDNKVPKYNSADRELIMNVLLHGADISNPAKDWVVAKDWSNRIQEESLLQGDAERRSGMPISPNCDRATVNRPQFSLNFIDFIVAPMFVSLTQFVPKMYMACKKLRENRAEWAHLMVEKIQSSDMDSQHKADEFKKWDRRTKGFNLVMVPEERHNPPDAPPSKHRKDSIQVSQMIGTMLNASQRDIRVPKTLPKMRTHTTGAARAKTARPRASPASFRRNSTPQPNTPSSKSPSPAPAANVTSSDEA